ncbi:unnamed protein product [Paramecium octaurelia]|uniref:ABC transporter domain-containing protein n=1 Tax=Paramecium octaurelia TaxID=43137 RepID=A0A8S1W123_PAROT|nr:unnamed protein product [Paramecium octaurelia]
MKKSYQFRALFYKNAALQSRQIGTNLCQMFTPLLCLGFVYLIQEVAFDQFKGANFSLDFPYLFNVPVIYSGLPGLLNLTCLQWYYFNSSQLREQDKQFLGYNDGNQSLGLLRHILQRPGCSYETQDHELAFKNVPFLQQPNSTINQDIYHQIEYLHTVPFVRGSDLQDLYLIPDGAYTFFEANEKKINMSIQVNDIRLHEYHRSNGITKIRYQNKVQPNKTNTMMLVAEGQIATIDLISRALLHHHNPNVWLVSGIEYMPLKGQDKSFLLKLINVVGAMLYPLSLSLLLPVFLYAIVLEKEERLLQMMKMNGMKMKDYWILQYLFSGLMTLLTFSLFLFTGIYLVGIALLTDTNLKLLIIVLTGWGLCQISLSFFFQVFVSKARTATIIGYLLSVWGSIIALTANLAIYPDPYEIPIYLQMIPQIAFNRIIYIFSMACAQTGCISQLSPLTSEVQGCIISLYVNFIVFGLLGVYLHEIIPQEFGVSSEPWIFRLFKKKKIEFRDEDEYKINIQDAQEDQDSKNERDKVYRIKNYEDYPLICKDLRKTYQNNVAVKCFCIAVEQGEIFGLLGPNGAGKTSILSAITGLYPCNDGEAYVGGYSIKTNMQSVQMNIGVCPQFDLLWPELTVEEHLLFYARLKGIDKQNERAKVQQSMAEVKLEPYFNYYANQLSGGMKRRLSIAIALVGEPLIIFLDEPSTGLDPDNRRQLWDIISHCKGKRAMVLTTHSMEEADVLCTRIGIISSGVLRCIGQSTHLKSIYGGGYHLFISSHKELYLQKNNDPHNQYYYQNMIKNYLKSILPQAILVQEFNGNFIYQVEKNQLVVSEVFQSIESKKEELRIQDWGISQATLEDVFMRVVEM